MCSLGFGIVWYSHYLGDPNVFFLQIKQRLTDISVQQLRSKINAFRPEYFDYHPDFGPARYIYATPSFRTRRTLALLRTFSLPIKNNLLKLDITSDNICMFCSTTYVENEFHLLFRCSKYNALRQDILPFFTYPSFVNCDKSKFKFLLSCHDDNNTKELLHYLTLALKEAKITL